MSNSWSAFNVNLFEKKMDLLLLTSRSFPSLNERCTATKITQTLIRLVIPVIRGIPIPHTCYDNPDAVQSPIQAKKVNPTTALVGV